MVATASSNHASRASKTERRSGSSQTQTKTKVKAQPRKATTAAKQASHQAKTDVQARKIAIPPALIVVVGLLIVLVMSGFIMYPVGHDLYLTYRVNHRAGVEFQAVEDRNTAIQEQIDMIQTPEGIEDRAREQFGWVREGEEAVNITGLSVSESSTVLPDAVAPGSILPYDDWWTQVFDEFFGYEYQPPAQLSPETEPVPGL